MYWINILILLLLRKQSKCKFQLNQFAKKVLDMRKILEFPPINENDIAKVKKLIDIIADNLDRDCRNELDELQSLTGKLHSVEEFAEYWGWTDLDNLARIRDNHRNHKGIIYLRGRQ